MNKIILIGGPPRSGKTTLARKIATETNIPWISSDTLESVVSEYVPSGDRDTLFPKAVLRRTTNYGNDEMYKKYSTEEIVSAYQKQAETAHKAIETLVAYAKSEGWDYVIEGYHVTPKLLAKLAKVVSSVVLVNTKSEESIQRSKDSDVKSDWVRDKTQNDETFLKIADMINLYSHRLIEESNEYGTKVIDMKDDFEQKCKEAFLFLAK